MPFFYNVDQQNVCNTVHVFGLFRMIISQCTVRLV